MPAPSSRTSVTRLLRGAALVLASIAIHAAFFGAPALSSRLSGARVRPAPAQKGRLAERAAALALPITVAADRRELVERARAERVAGRLSLGAFLLRAGAIDAREDGRAFDETRARGLYEARLARLREASPDEVRDAIAAVFSDLHYLGRAGGSMGEALLARGGSCEPLSHLLAAALHDAGGAAHAYLRFYGGGSESGATHLAPVYRAGEEEHDLLAGAPARRGGSLFPAADLVEVYARVHGLSIDPGAPGDMASGGGDGESAEPPEREARTLVDGYPANHDRFPGTTPLYADRAVRAPSDLGVTPPSSPTTDGADCAFFVRFAALDPPLLGVAGPTSGPFAVEVRRVPSSARLDRIFGILDVVERGVLAEPADRLMAAACQKALLDEAASGLALLGEHDLARRALARGRVAAAEGEAEIAAIDWDAAAGARQITRLSERYAGRAWLLLFLRGGDAVALRLGGDARREGWGRISVLAGLLVAPGTRRAALSLVGALPVRQQIDVMHEVFHAHDHQRPWASSYVLEDAADTPLGKAYRVFRPLAWGLWEGARPQREVLAALLREAGRAGLDRAFLAAIIEYYGRNAVVLHQHRRDGDAQATELKRWLRDNAFTDLELYRVTLAEVE